MSAFRRTFSGYPDAPGYKARETSQDAADGVAGKAKSLRARVYDILKQGPATPEEIAMILAQPVHNIRPRLSELSARKLIEDSGERGPAMGGRMAIRWRLT